VSNDTILITGGSGQVGGAIARLAERQGLRIWTPTRTELDLASPTSITSAISERPIAAVINCAAYTAVDKAEAEPELAEAINAIAPRLLAQETARKAMPIIHVSTDYVFDGKKSAPYIESDPINPISVYGRTKEQGEAAIRAENPNHAIVRTAWVLSAGGANFLNTMLRLSQERNEISVVNDQLGCPTSADDIAAALLVITKELNGRAGTWHFVNGGEASWHGLAAYIFAESGKRGMSVPILHAITTADYPTPACRPANSRLATDKIESDFSISVRPWQAAIDDILAARLS
jgi:dTDP-4-dehydrorhamnose reductase